MRSLSIAGLALLLAAGPARAEEPFGAVSAAPLPSGALALWGMAGYPELRAGFREGLRSFEIGAEAGFDYLQAKVYAVGALRALLWQQGATKISLDLQGGAFANGGARLGDPYNEGSAGLRLGAGSLFTYKTEWPVSVMAFVRLPFEVPLTDSGSYRLAALVGGGAEIAVSPDSFISILGGFGPELRRVEGGSRARFAVEAMVGFGYRMF